MNNWVTSKLGWHAAHENPWSVARKNIMTVSKDELLKNKKDKGQMSKQTEYDLQVLIHYNQQEQYGVRDEFGRL